MREINLYKRLIILIAASLLIVSIFSVFSSVSASIDETVEITLESSTYEINDMGDGSQEINMDGYSSGHSPGNPDLPYKTFNILVHPDIDDSTLQLQLTSYQQLQHQNLQ